jgi:hypothetical protein
MLDFEIVRLQNRPRTVSVLLSHRTPPPVSRIAMRVINSGRGSTPADPAKQGG